jgi:murein L,D-transpeptidase YafK
MRAESIFIVLSIVLLLAVSGVAAHSKSGIPSSHRSTAAINRVKASLVNELTEKKLSYGAPIFIRIFKEEKELEVWVRNHEEFQLFKTYAVCTYGFGTLGPKIKQGDGQAPEGFYFVRPAGLNPSSEFHLSFNLGYPNAYDRSRGRTGSALMVHGDCVSIGCYAMTDSGIEEIYALAHAAFSNGQEFFRAHIFPFRMTASNMKRHRNSRWYAFWENLKQGYDFFESNGHVPPNVEVVGKKYDFGPS